MSHVIFKPKLLALLMAAAGLLSACGGGGGGGGSTAITTPLRIGMTVSVEQSGTDALTLRPIAGKIWVQSGIKGVASYIGSTLTVAGMPVTTDTSTILLSTTGAVTNLTALNNQAVGTVQSMDTTAKTLVLGTTAAPITVNYASITPPNGLTTGSVIVVKAATNTTANTYTASSLQIRSGTASTYTRYASNYSGTTRVRNERNELYGAVSDKTLISSGSSVTG